MTISSPHSDLFQQPTTTDWISFLRSRMKAHDLAPREALALTGLIHAQLRKPNSNTGAVYAQYARTMSALNHELPDVHQHVINNWLPPRSEPLMPLPDFLENPVDAQPEPTHTPETERKSSTGSEK